MYEPGQKRIKNQQNMKQQNSKEPIIGKCMVQLCLE